MDAFYALATNRRRKIVELLASNGELTATEISKEFEITAQAISQHLRILLEAGILSMQRRAQNRIYTLNPDSIMEIQEWAKSTRILWNHRLHNLGKFLESE